MGCRGPLWRRDALRAALLQHWWGNDYVQSHAALRQQPRGGPPHAVPVRDAGPCGGIRNVSLHRLDELLDRYPPITRVAELAADPSAHDIDVHALLGTHPLVAHRIRSATTTPLLVLTPTGSGADDMAAALQDFAPD